MQNVNLGIKHFGMNKYEFTPTFLLLNSMDDSQQYLDALYIAGCDDALVCTSQSDRISLAFLREAESAKAGIKTAIENVNTAIPGAELIEASPDLVGLTDIAEILKVRKRPG